MQSRNSSAFQELQYFMKVQTDLIDAVTIIREAEPPTPSNKLLDTNIRMMIETKTEAILPCKSQPWDKAHSSPS